MVLFSVLTEVQASILLPPGIPETSLWPQNLGRLYGSKEAYDKGTSPVGEPPAPP